MNDTELETMSETTLLIVNIGYSNNYRGNASENDDFPSTMILDIPTKILEQRERDNYLDIIESFVYSTISGKVGREVSFCQIYFQ